MAILHHVTSASCASAIIRSGTIFGSNMGEQSHEAYPHFFYDELPRCDIDIPVEPEIDLAFECNLSKEKCTYEPPEPGYLNMHFTDQAYTQCWQCTLHPGSDPLTFIGYKILVQDISDGVVKQLDNAKLARVGVHAIWHPQSLIAHRIRQPPLQPQPSFWARLLGRR